MRDELSNKLNNELSNELNNEQRLSPVMGALLVTLLFLPICRSAHAQLAVHGQGAQHPQQDQHTQRAQHAQTNAHARQANSARWQGDIARFHEQDWHRWQTGRWEHGRHDGRLGWWWVIGAAWYFYPTPIYPYPNPWEPTVTPLSPLADGALLPPPTQYWYYCPSSRTYYPYVGTCPVGWQKVPASPPSDGVIP